MAPRHTLTALLTLALTSGAYADTISVPKDQKTIAAAIAVAMDGDRIEIKRGKYTEDVVVNDLDNLTIVGKGPVTLLATNIGLQANDCANLTIQNVRTVGGEMGFDFQDCDGVLLEKFSVKDVEQFGVHAAGGGNIRVIRGKVTDSRIDGVSFADEEPGRPVLGGEVTRVTVKDCTEDGIDILGRDVTVSKCTVKDARDDGFESDADGIDNITFDRCKSIKVGDEGFEFGTQNTKATNCTAIKAGEEGFDIEDSNCRLENCKSVKSEHDGFEVEDSDSVILIGCKAIKSGGDGFSFFSATNGTVDGCKSVKSGSDGFYFDSDSSGNTVRNNKSTTAGDDDLDDETGGGNTIEDNNKFKSVEINT